MPSKFAHVSVLLDEVIDALDIVEDGIYMDGTTGGAGHSSAILEQLGAKGHLYCFDRDIDALDAAKKQLSAVESKGSYTLIHSEYANFDRFFEGEGISSIQGALLDLGVSSWQLDAGDRGFSYMHNGPLDMRMNQEAELSAYEIVNTWPLERITQILRDYGEEKEHYRIAKAIVRHREEIGNIEDTNTLANLILQAMSAKARRMKGHPAKRSFQAIRMQVNNELGELESFLDKILYYLSPGAVLAIITFHSLEDRIVKRKFREWENPCQCPPNLPCVCGKKALGEESPRGGIVASEEEANQNRRSHSARLRVFKRNQEVSR